MKEKTIDNLINQIFHLRPELKDKLIGCTEDEIIDLEKKFNLSLPQFYKSFILKMGRYGCGFLRDEYYEYKELIGDSIDSIQDYGITLLKESGSNFILPNNAFVFLANPEGAFWYFLCEEQKKLSIPNVYFFLPRLNNGIPQSLDMDLYEFFLQMVY